MTRWIAPWAALALMFALVTGCAPKEEAPVEPAPTTETPGDAAAETTETGAEASEGALTSEQIEMIRQLPEADAELALVQKTCPVSDEPLGSMGVPIKVTVKNRDVFVCCAGCEGSVEDDPDTYLAKVPQGGPELPSMGGSR
ncbi:hypothetical protein [Tautonia marina]|uniref:hypothetical protein n=1 Tax=Tautonia marina TaxID=2653855 RepID=UPI0012604625|nr:hypothetical protein [Tautonia marina]